MTTTRREFMRRMGISIASLMVARCAAPTGGDTPRDRARDCWAQLESLAETTRKDRERGERERERLTAGHRAALDGLVGAGALNAAVADHVHAAFTEAVYHVWCSNAPITGCEPVLADYAPTSSGQLAQQADVLAGMAAAGGVDAGSVAMAEAAIAHDIAFLTLSEDDLRTLYGELVHAASDGYDFPSFDELDLEVSPQAAGAARFLVGVLLGP